MNEHRDELFDQIIFRWEGNRDRAGTGITAVAYSCGKDRAEELRAELAPLLRVEGGERSSLVRYVRQETGEVVVINRRRGPDAHGRGSTESHALVGSRDVLKSRFCLTLSQLPVPVGGPPGADSRRLEMATRAQLEQAAGRAWGQFTARVPTVKAPLAVVAAQLLRTPDHLMSVRIPEFSDEGRNYTPLLIWGLCGIFADWLGRDFWTYATYDTSDSNGLRVVGVPVWRKSAIEDSRLERIVLRNAPDDEAQQIADELVRLFLSDPDEAERLRWLRNQCPNAAALPLPERLRALRRLLEMPRGPLMRGDQTAHQRSVGRTEPMRSVEGFGNDPHHLYEPGVPGTTEPGSDPVPAPASDPASDLAPNPHGDPPSPQPTTLPAHQARTDPAHEPPRAPVTPAHEPAVGELEVPGTLFHSASAPSHFREPAPTSAHVPLPSPTPSVPRAQADHRLSHGLHQTPPGSPPEQLFGGQPYQPVPAAQPGRAGTAYRELPRPSTKVRRLARWLSFARWRHDRGTGDSAAVLAQARRVATDPGASRGSREAAWAKLSRLPDHVLLDRLAREDLERPYVDLLLDALAGRTRLRGLQEADTVCRQVLKQHLYLHRGQPAGEPQEDEQDRYHAAETAAWLFHWAVLPYGKHRGVGDAVRQLFRAVCSNSDQAERHFLNLLVFAPVYGIPDLPSQTWFQLIQYLVTASEGPRPEVRYETHHGNVDRRAVHGGAHRAESSDDRWQFGFLAMSCVAAVLLLLLIWRW